MMVPRVGLWFGSGLQQLQKQLRASTFCFLTFRATWYSVEVLAWREKYDTMKYDMMT